MEEAVKIKLPAFEGPLDLLLHLIREHKMDIYDIQINLITEQYLEYIEMMKELDLEVAGDFLVMAATLVHIKSRMLLPIEDTADTDEPEDPRLELVMKLLEYKAFKDAALALQEKHDEWSEVIPRTPFEDETPEDEEEPDLSLFDLNLFDLLSAFNKMLEKAPPEVRIITREILTVKDKMNLIIESLKANDAMRFESLFKGDVSLSHFLVTFIALLELIKLGLARCYQKEGFTTIWVINPEAQIERESLGRREEEGSTLRITREGSHKPISATIRGIVDRSRKENLLTRTRELALETHVTAPMYITYHYPVVTLPSSDMSLPKVRTKGIGLSRISLPR